MHEKLVLQHCFEGVYEIHRLPMSMHTYISTYKIALLCAFNINIVLKHSSSRLEQTLFMRLSFSVNKSL